MVGARGVGQSELCLVLDAGLHIDDVFEVGMGPTRADLRHLLGRPALELFDRADRKRLGGALRAAVEGEGTELGATLVLEGYAGPRVMQVSPGERFIHVAILAGGPAGPAEPLEPLVAPAEAPVGRPRARLEYIGMVASRVSHEFRNVLATVLVDAEFLRRDAVELDVVHEVADEIRIATERACELIEQIFGHAGSEAEPRAAVDRDALTRDRDFEGYCVLVIDDDDLLRTVTGRALRYRGFEVLTARDGLEGIAQFDAHHARLDAVLLDMGMPLMEGSDVLDELRRLDGAVPVIFVSGRSKEELQQQSAVGRADGVVRKPFRDTELLDAIRGAVQRRRAASR
ncbi:response regulator [Paraliomyxa miuraensis]|uniref:response regulator n=1 Tax=Paraliomyxa miuraensis TaxID=376150 RepID=UPI002257FE98|nr:response regulator [Paraliomyxa miuraensis]MCX4242892.1 response regulator [Paraliomyxa miuraensis]